MKGLDKGLIPNLITSILFIPILYISILTIHPQFICGTGKSFLEALILLSTNPQYDKRLFIDLPVLTQKLQAQNMLCTYIVFLFLF